MRTVKLSFITLVIAVLAISCSEEHGHEHHGGVSKLLWEDIPCESLTSVQFLGKGKMGGGENAWEVNSIDEIKKLIKESIPDASIEIKDLMGDNNHYSATIRSELFKNLNKIEQHKLVYKSLKGKM